MITGVYHFCLIDKQLIAVDALDFILLSVTFTMCNYGYCSEILR